MSAAESGAGPVLVADEGRVRTLTLSRPAALNAFDDAQYDAVRDALLVAADDPGVAVVVVTGEGRAFSAGQDLGEMARPPRHDDGQPHGFPPFLDALSTFPKPLVAAVNGLAVGIGVTMLLHCDVVLVSDQARLRAPFVSLGIAPEAGSTVLLPALVGWQAASEVLLSSAWVEAARAVEIGLAARLVPAAALAEEAAALAASIAAMPLPSLLATKRLLRAARGDAVAAAIAREGEEIAALRGGPANREALAAFRERRPADFTGIT